MHIIQHPEDRALLTASAFQHVNTAYVELLRALWGIEQLDAIGHRHERATQALLAVERILSSLEAEVGDRRTVPGGVASQVEQELRRVGALSLC